MYVIEFLKRTMRRSNIPVLIYLLLNVYLITELIQAVYASRGPSLYFWDAFRISVVVYAISLTIALSPIGEWILRRQTRCVKIEDGALKDYLTPLFNEVYQKAKEKDNSISDKVQLYITEDDEPNEFATGRKTICITTGLLQLPDELIKATLAHEFGHLAHKDTDLILVVSVGNMIVTGFILAVRLALTIMYLFFSFISIFFGGEGGFVAALAMFIYHTVISLVVSFLTWIWTKIGILLTMKSSRSNEYEADAFAVSLGYGNDLRQLLTRIDSGASKGLFASLVSSHPDTVKRLEKINELMYSITE